MKRRQAVLIASPPRSGAGMLAALLSRAGAMAGSTFVPQLRGHAEPTWQSAPVAALNDRLLDALGQRWDALAPMPERWVDRPAIRALEGEADALLASEFAAAPWCVIKDPRLALTGAFWRERLGNAGFDVAVALVVRRPMDMAASLKRLEPFAPEKSLALWLHYLAECERGSRTLPRALVAYEHLVTAPLRTLAGLVAGLRLPLGKDALEAAVPRSAGQPVVSQASEGRGPRAAGLSSGIDSALEDGYRELIEEREERDLKAVVDKLLQAAHRPLLQAIPPWLGQELANARAQSERHAEAGAAARARIAVLEKELASALSRHAVRDRSELRLQEHIDALTRANGDDVRVHGMIEALQQSVAGMAASIAGFPQREEALRLDLNRAQRDLADERQTISRLSDSIEQERQACNEHVHNLELARQHYDAMSAELEATRSAAQTAHQHEQALAHEIDEVRHMLGMMQSERDALRKERDEAARQLEKLQVEFESARTDLRIVDHDRNALAARAQAVSDAASALREELGRRAAAEAAWVVERDRLLADGRKQADRMIVLERELSRRVGELQALSGRHDMLARTLGALERTWLGRQALAGMKRPGGDTRAAGTP